MAENDSKIFVIEAADAEKRATQLGLTVPQLLPLLVPAAQALARPPISNFCVGAAGLGISGRVYLGVNLEFRRVPLNQSVHAEQFLVINAIAHGERKISHIAVSAVPCGHCRQFLQELRGASEIQILVTSNEIGVGFRPLSDLIPQPFGPHDLLHEDCPLLMEPRRNRISLVEEESLGIRNGESLVERKAKEAALSAARTAYAPYSGCPSGFALVDENGNAYAGAYAESAAYNPSMGPVQAALVAYVVGNGCDESIEAAALVEKEDAVVSHEETARILMGAISPRCRLAVYRCIDD